ncbi:DUF6776 family protein [Parashewanella tropica]|uniref:DUF6776 family protein n=1 Tax=Parashewanella tropica TaxID=2547970 RepID=UPI00105A4FDD|nr:DUF6776 family protein [Parashewanella tropica]
MSRSERRQDRLRKFEQNYFPINRYVFLVVLLAFVAGGASYFYYEQLSPVPKQGNAEIKELKNKLNTQSQELAQRNLELSIAHQSNQNLRNMFAKKQASQADIERELAFYRSIMAPETSAQGISIYDLRLDKTVASEGYELNLILTQLKKRRSSLTGYAELTLIGEKNGKEIKQSINQLTKNDFKFRFRFFQSLQARLDLPKGVNWKQLRVKVKVPASRWSKAEETERSFDINKLLADPEGSQ